MDHVAEPGDQRLCCKPRLDRCTQQPVQDPRLWSRRRIRIRPQPQYSLPSCNRLMNALSTSPASNLLYSSQLRTIDSVQCQIALSGAPIPRSGYLLSTNRVLLAFLYSRGESRITRADEHSTLDEKPMGKHLAVPKLLQNGHSWNRPSCLTSNSCPYNAPTGAATAANYSCS